MRVLRRILIAGGVLAVAFALLAAVGVVFEIVWGEYAKAIQFVNMTAVCAAFAVASRPLGLDDASPRAETDGVGTTFLPDRRLDIPLQVAVFGLIVNVLCSAYLPFPDPRSGSDGWLTATVASFAVVLAVLLVQRNLRWGASKYLRLTPTGIELGYLRRQSCDWGQVRAITGVRPGRRARKSHDVLVVVSDTILLRLPAATFTKEGTALRDLVHFYWQNPQARGELADGSAPRRLAAMLPMSR